MAHIPSAIKRWIRTYLAEFGSGDRVTTVTPSATPTPNMATSDIITIDALASAAELQTPTGATYDGQPLTIRIRDNGTNRALTYTAAYRVIGVTLPITTTANKWVYIGGRWNSGDSKLDVLAVGVQT